MRSLPAHASFFDSSRRESIFGADAVLSAGAVALLVGRDALAQAARPTQAQLETDVRILNTALGAELEAVAAYQLGADSGLLSAGAEAIALQFQGHHKEHAEVLAGTVRKLGGEAAGARARYDFPTDKLTAEVDVLRFAAGLECGAVSAYLNAVPLVQDRALAQAAASILGDEAMHWAVFRQLLGDKPVVPGLSWPEPPMRELGILMLSCMACSAAAAAAADDADDADDAALLRRGEEVYARCAGCHAIEQHRTGPAHRGLFGRKAGTAPGFDRYSPALQASGIVWDEKTLARFLARPMTMVPGTTMTYLGVNDAKDREALIAWLKKATQPGQACKPPH
jgi:cytochrome c2